MIFLLFFRKTITLFRDFVRDIDPCFFLRMAAMHLTLYCGLYFISLLIVFVLLLLVEFSLLSFLCYVCLYFQGGLK